MRVWIFFPSLLRDIKSIRIHKIFLPSSFIVAKFGLKNNIRCCSNISRWIKWFGVILANLSFNLQFISSLLLGYLLWSFSVWLHFCFRFLLNDSTAFILTWMIILFRHFYFIQQVYWFTYALIDLDLRLTNKNSCVLWTTSVELFGELFHLFLTSDPASSFSWTGTQSYVLSFDHRWKLIRWDGLTVPFEAISRLNEEPSFNCLNMHHIISGVGAWHDYLIIKKPSLLLDGLSSKKRLLRHGRNSRIANLQDPDLTWPRIIASDVKTLNKFINILGPVAIWFLHTFLLE